MSSFTFGDMAQFNTLRRQGAGLRSDLARLTSELASGQASDKGRAVAGDFSTLADITRGLRLNEAFKASISNAAISAAGRQSALGRVAVELEGFGTSLLAMSGTGNTSDAQLTLTNATDRFEQAVNALNTRLSGRSVFAADALEAAPLAQATDILSELETVTSGMTDAASIEAAIVSWFNDSGGGYETFAWRGGDGPAESVLLGEGNIANSGVTALDPAIRETLAGLAIAALAADRALGLSSEQRGALVARAGQQVLSSEASLIELRARLGSEEARIEDAKVSAETARGALELEYGRLLDADPYRTATELEAVNLQLESLYILTARMSRLSLTEFLR